MPAEEATLKKYIRDVLGIELEIEAWENAKSFPVYLRELYAFRKTVLLGHPYLLMIDRGKERLTPKTIETQYREVTSRWNGNAMYVSAALSSVDRARLVKARVPFIVPGRQMYLLPLGIDFREVFKPRRVIKEQISPASQVLLLYSLLNHKKNLESPTFLAKKFEYSAMTIVRALDEFEERGLATRYSRGKERLTVFIKTGRQLWEAVRDSLRSPVKRTMIVDLAKIANLHCFESGLSALSRKTMLAPPDHPVYAVRSMSAISAPMRNALLETLDEADTAAELELWSYDPGYFAVQGIVDPLSLYLSCRNDPDERVQQALSFLMEGMQW